MSGSHRKIALISTMSPDKTWAQEVLDRVSESHGDVKSKLEKMGFTVVDEGPLLRSYHELMAAGRSFRAQGVNALVFNVGTWTYANCAAAAALEAGVPVVVLPDSNPGTCGLVGGVVANGGLKELGIHSHLIYGPPNDEQTWEKIRRLLNAACAAMSLRGQMMGLGGGRSMGMLSAVVDPNEVRLKFGIEIDAFEQMVIIDRAEKVSEERVAPFFAWMKKSFGKIIAKEDAVKKQIRLYLALKDFCDEQGYDFLAVKCLPELPAVYTTFCLAHAIMGDCEDHEGPKERFVFSCEADIQAALTMQILKQLSEGPVLFSDLTQFDWNSEVLTTCNCGSQPTDFAASKKDVYWEKEGVHEFDWKFGGTCPQAVARPGVATIARLARKGGQYQMLIAPAEVVEMDREKLKETIWERPHTFIKLLCDRNEFFDKAPSNHLHLIYGDYRMELEEVCRILDVEPIVIE